MAEDRQESRPAAHGGVLAVAAARAHGVSTMFTLSGGHVFPLYDGAVTADPPMRLLDVRHEQTAVFAAEATARLTRTPGLAVLTAGPGVTNGVSAVTTAYFNGSPVVVLAGRAPDYRWGSGSLQEFDHPALLAPITKRAWTEHETAKVGSAVDDAFRLASTAHRGPVFLDIALEALFGQAPSGAIGAGETAGSGAAAPADLDPGGISRIAQLIAGAARPGLVLGSGVGGTVGAPRARRVVHIPDAPGQVAGHCPLAAGYAGDLAAFFAALPGAVTAAATGPAGPARLAWEEAWLPRLQAAVKDAMTADSALLTSAADPIHPMRIYGELAPQLDDDAVVIGDGGDFVSYAGKYIEPKRPGGWLDPGPYGCLGTGLGYAIAARVARPSGQVVLLLGDGAAGFSLMDADTLVRHGLPVVMICGNNGIWGLEKHPMQAIYGYDVAADLQPGCRYDEVVTALGGAGELVTRPEDIGPALRRAFDSGVPYLVNVLTDPAIAYPRSTTGI